MIRDLDIRITKTCNQLTIKNKFLTSFLKFITHSSSGIIYIVYAIAIPFLLPKYGVSIIKLGIIGFGFQVPIYILSKNLIKRERPYVHHNINQAINPPDKYSFPSGHCASSTLLTLTVNQYMPWVTPYLIIWLATIIYSRIGLGLHYFSDALFGVIFGVISFLIANLFVTAFL